MQEKQIIFHKTFGFGIITGISYSYANVKFSDGVNRKIKDSFLLHVNEETVNYIIDGRFSSYFDQTTIQQSRALLENNPFEVIYKGNGCFEADIFIGSDFYFCSVTISNDTLISSCSCPEKNCCMHAAAILFRMQTAFSYLSGFERMIAKDWDSMKLLSDELTGCTDDFFINRDSKVENIMKIIEDLSNNDEVYLKAFLTYLFLNYRDSGYQDLLSYITYNDTVRKNLILIRNSPQYCSSMRFLNNCIREVNIVCDNLTYNRKYDLKSVLNYHLYNFQYREFIKKVIFAERFIFDGFYRYFVYVVERIEPDEEILKSYIQLSSKSKDISFLEPLYNRFSDQQKLSLILDGNSSMKVKYSQIMNFDDEIRKSLLLKVEFDNREIAQKAIRDGQKLFGSDYRSLAQLYINIDLNIHSYFDDSFTKNLINEVRRLPYNTYLLMYFINHHNPFNIENNYLRSYYDYRGQTDYTEDFTNVRKIDFFYYFKPYYEIRKDEDSYEITYYLLSSANQRIIQANFDSMGNFTTYFNSLENSFNAPYISYLKYFIDQNNSDQIGSEVEKIVRQIEERKRAERNRILLNDINQLKLDNTGRTLLFDERFRVSLDYIFTIDSGNRISVEFRVGNSRKYVVKDAILFLDNFNEGKTVDYGKSLQLTHKIENFISRDQNVLKQLLKLDFSYQGNFYDKKKLNINQSLFKEIVYLLDGSTVTINNTVFLVDIEKTDIRIRIDENYIMSLDSGSENDTLYIFDDFILIADYAHNSINLAESDKNSVMAYRFVQKNEGFDIKDVIEPFKEKIYAYYPEIIDVDESLKEQFHLSNMVIRSYFDYDEKNITVDSKYFIEEKEVSREEIKRDYDRTSLNIYENCLQSLGFRENAISDDADVLSFLRMDFSALKQLCEVYLSESITNKIMTSFTAPTVRIRYKNDLMAAVLQDSIYSNEELEQIIKAIRQKKKYVLLKGDRIVSLDKEDAEMFADTVDDLGMDISLLNEENQLSMAQSLKAFAHEKNCQIDDYLREMIRDISSFKEIEMDIPHINGELRQYQIEGYKWMKLLEKYHVGGILADDMGLGKTIEVIALMAENTEEKPYLVICPKSVVFNWKYEINRFAPQLTVKEIYGNKAARRQIINSIEPDKKVIYLSAYDSLRNDIEDYDVEFNYVIIDEAQYIKNVNALKTLSVKQIKAAHRIALTGTPIENNIIDLWSIFDFIMPGYFENLTTFRSRYSESDKFTDIVARRIAPFILRRTKENVINDLPEKYERILSAEMTVDQQKLYDSVKLNAQKMLSRGGKAFDLLPYLTRLRQICVNPATFVEDYSGGSGKMNLLKDIVSQYIPEGRRLLIFSSFVKALNEIETMLNKMNIEYFMITGATDARERIDIADRFNNGSYQQIVLISLKAGGTGLNLVGADTVIHLDPWWNVSAENQATDRAHRIGQTNTVEVIKLICSDSIEQRVIELQNMKKDLIDRLISDDEQSVLSSSIEDIKFILD